MQHIRLFLLWCLFVSSSNAVAQVELGDISAIATGTSHSCALTTDGGVKCWGYNFNGQLGNNSATQRLTAVNVAGLSSGVSAIAAGGNHTCALTTTGGVKCWGSNGDGQLGDNSTTQRPTAVDVVGLSSGVSAIAAGTSHTCALTTGGGVKCWGNNGFGQLGDNSTTQRLAAVDVAGLTSGVSAIAAGFGHTCALTTGGGVKCWGANFNGQLGDNSTTQRLTAVDVSTLTSGVSAIATGTAHTCALTTGGGVKCWGFNGNGQLGDNSTTQRRTAVDVFGLSSGVSAIAAGNSHTCALTSGGGVKCWGANGIGQLGDNSTTQRLTAVDVAGLTSGVSAIATGAGASASHTCALTTDGGVKCWGSNSFGQLGDNSTTQRLTAVDVSTLTSGVSAVATGANHTCALTTGGGVKCWGRNDLGQLGDNSTTQRLTAVDVVGLSSGVNAIAAGSSHTCALTSVGGVKCWGNNGNGQLGDNSTTQRLTAVDVVGLSSGVSAIATGANHTCALTTGGGVKCWGNNVGGQLGDNSTTQRLTAVDVSTLTSGVSAIATGSNHTCALTTGGGVKCWGNNFNGQLGDNSTTQRRTAVNVSTLTSGVSAIAAGNSHTCALTTGGGVKCWGSNSSGELGDNSTTQRLTTVNVATLTSGVSAIAAGFGHTCALTTGGGVKCWGNNGFGQLGDNSTTQRLTAVDVSTLSSGVSAIATGERHTCALTTGGGVKCWGNNPNGELGDGTLSGASPFPVITLTFRAPDAPMIGVVTAGDASVSVSFSAPASNGGSPITGYTALSNPGNLSSSGCTASPCTVAGLTNGAAYTFTVTATTAIGTGAPSAASNPVTPRADQAIIFGSAPTVVVGGTGTVSAMGGASGSPVVFSSQTPSVCTVSGTNGSTATGLVVGTCTIAANQAGSAAFNAAPEVTQSFGIDQSSQSITFGTAPTIVVDGTGTVSATGGASGNPVSFSSQSPAVCTVTGSTVSGVTAGSCVIAANQAGNSNYSAATEVTQSFSIGQGSQSITFGAAPTIVVDGTGMVSATGGASGNPVSFSSQSPAVCTVTGSTVSGVTAGSCVIAANQAGNSNYSAATEVTQAFSVGQGSQVTLGALATPASIAFDQTSILSTSGGSGTGALTYAVTAGGAFCSTTGSTLTGIGVGTCTVTATKAADDNYNAASATVDVEVLPAADLQISINDGTQYALPGGFVEYEILVGNAGPLAVLAARVQDPVPAGLANALWSCTPVQGASCPSANGSGGIDELVDLPVNAVLRYVFSASVTAPLGQTITNTATVTVPNGTIETDASDNTSIDVNTVVMDGLFANGFETSTRVISVPVSEQ